MEKIELSYPNKEFKIEEIWIDLSKQSIWKMKEIKIKTIQIPGISNSLKFWNFWSKHKVIVSCWIKNLAHRQFLCHKIQFSSVFTLVNHTIKINMP